MTALNSRFVAVAALILMAVSRSAEASFGGDGRRTTSAFFNKGHSGNMRVSEEEFEHLTSTRSSQHAAIIECDNASEPDDSEARFAKTASEQEMEALSQVEYSYLQRSPQEPRRYLNSMVIPVRTQPGTGTSDFTIA